MRPERARLTMVERQLRARGIDDERVLAAMAAVSRELFVPAELRDHAYDDSALSLGHGQTISQPYIVAWICQALVLRGGERVLDVGAGSGYQAAVLARLAGEVHAIERIPELAAQARANLEAAGAEVAVYVGDGTLGLPEHAPFAAIAVAAAAPRLPPPLYEQLEPGGRIVLPLAGLSDQRMYVLRRGPEGPLAERSIACRFVPLVGAEAY